MLKVNAGISRKLTRDFQSTGFSINIEGEICASLDDPELVVEKIKEFYDLAEESLHHQIERYEGESAIARRDVDSGPSRPQVPSQPSRSNRGLVPSSRRPQGQTQSSEQEFVPATNKQVQFLMNLGKRGGLTKIQLEGQVANILGREVGLYDLSKQEAGLVLDHLKAAGENSSPPRSR